MFFGVSPQTTAVLTPSEFNFSDRLSALTTLGVKAIHFLRSRAVLVASRATLSKYFSTSKDNSPIL